MSTSTPTAWPSAAPGTAVPGFLENSGPCQGRVLPHECVGRPHCRVWSLLVACPGCERWHQHGAGWGAAPMHAPGDVTHRVPHCPGAAGYSGYILVAPAPFRSGWQGRGWRRSVTPAGRAAVEEAQHVA